VTRRGPGEGAIYQRCDHPTCPPLDENKNRPAHRCRGHYVASVDFGIVNKKRRRKVVYGKTRGEVSAKLKAANSDKQQRLLILDAPTLTVWLRYWRDEIASEKIRPSTMAGYNTYIEQHIIPRIGQHRLDRLEPSHVRRLYSDMRKPCPEPDLAGNCPHKPSHGRAEASIRQCHAILSRALKVAEREGKVARNVATLVDPPDTHKNPRTPLTVSQARLVLKAAEGDAFESRWYAALWLGMRQGECLGLPWANVNLDEGWILVDQALQRVKGKGLVLVPPKSRASIRRIPLPPMVLSRLKVHWAKHVSSGRTSELVWNNDGKPIDPAKDYKRWGSLLEKAGVPYVALHAARNTTGSLLMAAGVPDKVASEILGHSSVQITQGHYQRGDIEQRTKAMLQLEQYAQ
jgi:integrase